MNLVLFGLLGFIGLQLVIGVIVSRRIRDEDDYLLAGRNLGYGLVTFSVFATWFGAETCVSSAAGMYEKGLAGGAAEPFGYGLCIVFFGLAFAWPLWRRGIVTIADFFRDRYSVTIECLVALILAVTSVFWAAAQIRAFGQVLSASTGTQLQVTIGLAAGVAIVYTVLGGLRADVLTDFIQGIVIILGLIMLLVVVVQEAGGVGSAWALVDTDRLRIIEPGASLGDFLETWAIPVFGSATAQELASRSMAARSAAVARKATLSGGALYIVVGTIPAFLGLIGYALAPDLADAEHILPHLAQRYLPTLLYLIFASALISAILSTVDSSLLAAGSLFSHNLVARLRPAADGRAKVRWARIGVVFCGLGAYALAVSAENIYDLVESSSSFGGAGLIVLLSLGLATRRGGPVAAAAALTSAIAVWAITSRVEAFPCPYLASMGAALVAFFFMAQMMGPGRSAVSGGR